ncbi:MAG: acyl-CoA thioesterase [Anaerolineaceae bacterium]|jgi:acyl-CoA thioester hydrolase|nr:acyl-CoA thioesterase [Anaerolineaceae bacterium]
MTEFRFYHPIQVRFSDLDTQWHVNNARYITFLEDARISYLKKLDLFDGKSFHDLHIIVANININYLAPIHPNQKVSVGLRVSRLGNKSMTISYQIEDQETGKAMARAETIMVAYDYITQQSVPISQEWRQKISAFEDIPMGPPKE